MVTCTRDIWWCSGHRVLGHENKCGHLHGHNYCAQLEAEADDLDDKGRVIDFSVLKAVIGQWIEAKWDHGFILNNGDATALAAVAAFNRGSVQQKLYGMAGNPTAENIAAHLFQVGNTLLADAGHAVRLVSVTVHETPNCRATYSE